MNAGIRYANVQRLQVVGSLPDDVQNGFLYPHFHFLASFPSVRHLVLSGGRDAPLLPIAMVVTCQRRSERVTSLLLSSPFRSDMHVTLCIHSV